MSGSSSELARRLGDHAEAVCREYLSNGRRVGNYWIVGDVRNTEGRSMHVRLKTNAKGRAGKWVDEATSAVDPRSEEILTRATEELFVGKTQILIAHRLSTVRSCDRVLWLQNGRVHRLGTPSEVLEEFERAELDL